MELLLRHSKLAGVIAFAVAVAVLGALWFVTSSNRLYASAVTEHEFTHLAEFAQLEHEIFIEQTRHLLSVLSHVPQLHTPENPECSAILAAIVRDEPRYANISVLDTDGSVVCSALPLVEPIDSSKSILYPLKQGDAVVGVVAASVKLSWLEHLAEKAKLPPKASLTLVDSDGTTLTRYPDEGRTGEQAPETSYLYDRLQSARQGLGIVELEDPTGKKFMIAAVPLLRGKQEGFLHLIISLPKESLRGYTSAVVEAFGEFFF